MCVFVLCLCECALEKQNSFELEFASWAAGRIICISCVLEVTAQTQLMWGFFIIFLIFFALQELL